MSDTIACGIALAASAVALAYVVYNRCSKYSGISRRAMGRTSRKRAASGPGSIRPMMSDQGYEGDPLLEGESQPTKRVRRSLADEESSASCEAGDRGISSDRAGDEVVVDFATRAVARDFVETDQTTIFVDKPQSEEELRHYGEDESAVERHQRPRSLNVNSPLHAMGYYIDGDIGDGQGELKRIETGEKFKFVNQRHYELLGNAITSELYRIMLEVFAMVEIRVPLNATKGPTTAVYATRGIRDALFGGGDASIPKLLVLVHGSGAVRAGQWARSLIINDDLKWGSMLPYIKDAVAAGFEVIVTNGNEGAELGVPLNSSPSAHMKYVWENIVRKLGVEKIAFVAHSAGGYATVKLCHEFLKDFQKKVFAIALTDSAHGFIPTPVRDYISDVGRNWVTSNKPVGRALRVASQLCMQEVSAGHTKHEWTSGTARESVFDFFATREEKWDGKRKAEKKHEKREAAAERDVQAAAARDEEMWPKIDDGRQTAGFEEAVEDEAEELTGEEGGNEQRVGAEAEELEEFAKDAVWDVGSGAEVGREDGTPISHEKAERAEFEAPTREPAGVVEPNGNLAQNGDAEVGIGNVEAEYDEGEAEEGVVARIGNTPESNAEENAENLSR